jgi:membrane protein implicated in regulation of membrane protease activity
MGAIGASGAWLIAALVLGIAELAVPGVFLVFLAIAAAITGIAVYALSDLSPAAQLGAFAVWSVVTVLIGKRWYRDYPVEGGDPMLNDRAARMLGQVVIVETAIVRGHGRVLVGDGGWPARGPDAAVGERMRVVAVEDGTLIVEPSGV